LTLSLVGEPYVKLISQVPVVEVENKPECELFRDSKTMKS
jgi:hypothetical protein